MFDTAVEQPARAAGRSAEHSRFEAVRPALPRTLLAHVKPGPVDAEGWSLLAANASVAYAKAELHDRMRE